MTPTETSTILRQFNEWRRGDEDIPQPDPREIGEAIDAAIKMIEKAGRLESALRDVAQTLAWVQHGECRGFSDGLLTTNEALEKARDALEESK